MLTFIEQTRFDAYARGFGTMTAGEAIVNSLWNEKQASIIPKNDPAYTRYKNESDHYFNYAALLEKQAQL